MKRILLSVILVVVTTSVASAQVYKWWAGGKTSFWAETDRVTAVVAPEVGYHLTKKLTLAASVGIYSSKYNNLDPQLGIILNPYIRFNAIKKDNLVFFVNGGVEYGVGELDGFQLGFKPGMAILLSDRVTLGMLFGFIGYNDGKGIGGRREGIGFDLSGYQSGFALLYSF